MRPILTTLRRQATPMGRYDEKTGFGPRCLTCSLAQLVDELRHRVTGARELLERGGHHVGGVRGLTEQVEQHEGDGHIAEVLLHRSPSLLLRSDTLTLFSCAQLSLTSKRVSCSGLRMYVIEVTSNCHTRSL